ncbi:MAG: hypothetical protein H5T63_06710 [Chloroflexi bacterium]|nr:hypothetical protein [Chloroflexota bacterium]
MEDWFALVQDAFAALPRLADEAEWLQHAGLQPAEWDVLEIAYLCEPPPTVDLLAEWLPYTSPEWIRAQTRVLHEKGFLQALNEQEYFLTDRAVEFIETRVEQKRAYLAMQSPLPSRDLQRLAHLLARIVHAAVAAPPPPDKMRLLDSQRQAPRADAVPMVLTAQHLTDLLSFREDAYVAAWRAHGLDGPSVEVLMLLWRGEAADVDGLSAALSARRGYRPQDYARIAVRLQAHDWVTASGSVLTVTPSGRTLCEEIEETTNRYYMFPWTALLPVEVQQLRDLLQRFREALMHS